MIQEVYPGVYLIAIPLPENPLKNLNSYLIKGKKRNLLIDTGFNRSECLEAMTAGIGEIGADLDNTDIFLTHLHTDHSGLAGHLLRPKCRIYMGREDKDLFGRFKEDNYWSHVEDHYRKLGFSQSDLEENKRKNPAMIYLPPMDIQFSGIGDGERIELEGWDLRAVHTPGHTPGHMCLYDREKKILFSGDHIIFSITPNITSWGTMDDSLGSYLKSLDKVESLPVDHTFSAHRLHDGDLNSRIGELRRHHEERLEEAYSIVLREKKATVYTIASQMKWSIRARSWEDFPISQKWFAAGEADAHLEHLKYLSRIKRIEEKGVYYFVTVN